MQGGRVVSFICGSSITVPLSDEQVAAIQADPENPMNWCCYGAAVNESPRYCTCWEPTYSEPRAEPVEGVLQTIAPAQCVDCAYRHDSAEWLDDDERENLVSLARGRGVFTCHQGMAYIVSWRHPTTGMVVEAPPDAVGSVNTWAPLYRDAETPCKADGTPADLCHGWAARRLLEARRG